MVFAFGPGIGEEDIEGCHGFGGQKVLNCVRYFDSEQFDVCDVFAQDFLVHFSQSSQESVNAKEICLGVSLCPCCQKAALAATEIDFQRNGCVKYPVKRKK